LWLDRAPEVKTIRRKLGELAAGGKAADLIMALARHHAATRPDALGFLCVDGHARVYYGTRQVQKTHVARLKFPAPATMETWVTDAGGGPVFMVVAEPSDSLAGELRRLLPQLRGLVGAGRRVTVCFDRGGWSPALFADITGAGFDLLTWRKGPAPDIPADAFTTITCADDRGRAHQLLPGAEDPHLGGVHDADEEPGISGGVVGKVPGHVGEVPDSRQVFGGDRCLRAGGSRERRRRLSRPGPWSAADRGSAR
ncbi:MAG: putative transposase, partial [Streptosporangiaceae bacterium]